MRAVSSCALALLGLAMSAGAQAATVSYHLNQTNLDSTFPDGVDYALVSISDETAGLLSFSVTLLPVLASAPGSNPKISQFGFNVAGNSMPLGDAASSNAQWALPSGWRASVAPPPNQLDGFGRFEVSVETSGAATRLPMLNFCLANTGLTAASFAELSTGTAGQGAAYFAAHLTGLGASGQLTGYFAGSDPVPAPVPLPATAWLLLAGGAGLFGLQRRRPQAGCDARC